MNDLKYAIAYHTHHGDEYLCGLETACYGERVLPYFDRKRSSALPLTYDQAAALRDLIQKDCSATKFVVVVYPLRSEVPGNE